MFTAGWIVVTRNDLAVIIHHRDRSLTQTWAVFFSFRHFLQNQDNVNLLSRKLATIFFSTQISNFDSTRISYLAVSNLNLCLPSVFFLRGRGVSISKQTTNPLPKVLFSVSTLLTTAQFLLLHNRIELGPKPMQATATVEAAPTRTD